MIWKPPAPEPDPTHIPEPGVAICCNHFSHSSDTVMQIAIYCVEEDLRIKAGSAFETEGHEVLLFDNLVTFQTNTISATREDRANIIFSEQYGFVLELLWSFIRLQPGKRFFMMRDSRLASATADADTCNLILPVLAQIGIAINPNLVEHVGLPARLHLKAI
jgi:hypothetical protein